MAIYSAEHYHSSLSTERDTGEKLTCDIMLSSSRHVRKNSQHLEPHNDISATWDDSQGKGLNKE